MQRIENDIYISVSDWEQAGVTYSNLKVNILQRNDYVTLGKGREMLFLYSSLSMKHKSLFADAVKRFEQEEQAVKAQIEQKDLATAIKEAVKTNTSDILYFQNKGFIAEKLYKATIYARRAAWLRFLAEIRSQEIKKYFGCKSKTAFLEAALPVIHAENCFEWRRPNLQYLKILLVKWNKRGLDSCIDARNGKQNALKLTECTEKILLSIMASLHKPTAMQVWEHYNDFVEGKTTIVSTETGEVFDPVFYKKLSYASVQSLLSKPIFRASYAQIHGSDLTYRAKHGRYLERERPIYFGSMLTCDDWDLPVDLLPFEAKNERGVMKTYNKIKLYLFFDAATRHCVGYSYSHLKNTELFLAGLKNTLKNTVFSDKMPYELQSESHLLKQLASGVLREGELFAAVSILPKNPMGKLAETDIRTLKYGVLQKDQRFAEYFKGRHYARREAYRLEKEDQSKTKKLSIKDLPAFLEALVAAYNDAHPVTVPLHPNLLSKNPERLAYHLSETVKTTYRNGLFEAGKKRWVFSEIDSVLPRLKNADLEVKIWDNTAYVYQDGEFIAKAEEAERVQVSKLEKTQEDIDKAAKFYKNQYKLDKAVSDIKDKAEAIDMKQDWKQSASVLADANTENNEEDSNANFYDKFYNATKKKTA
jgi:hypothetical protein